MIGILETLLLAGGGITFWLAMVTKDRQHQQAKERFLSALVEAAPDCIQVLNLDGTRRFINRAGLALLGAQRLEDIADRPPWEFVAPADRARAKAWLDELLRGKPSSIELSLLALDGIPKRVEARGVPLLDSHSQLEGALVITRDISERARLQSELANTQRLYRMLTQVNQLILRRPGRQVLLERISQVILSEGGFTMVWIGLKGSDGKITGVHLACPPCANTAKLSQLLTSLAEDMIQQNKPYVANAPEEIADAKLRQEIGRCQISALAVFPIRVQGRIAGALKVCTQKRGFFDRAHLSLLQELAESIGYALEFEAISLERKLNEQELTFLAYHDPLTSLPNRRRLLEYLRHSIAHARRYGTGFALLLLDLDRFKDVNDSFGHSAGDRLLLQVAALFQARVRAGDLLARLGGDEFALVLDELHTPEDAGRVAAELIASLDRPWKLDAGTEVSIGASCGIALYPDHGSEDEQLLQHADAALYQAKAQGRGQFCYFNPALTERTRKRLHTASQLGRALQEQQLTIYFQPQMSAGGELVGAEALVRWHHPERKMILPAEFIPVAEQTGLIAQLDLWVLKELCRQGRAWLEAGFCVPTLAANLSPREFHCRKLDQTVTSILRETGFPADLLELELTETALMEHGQEASAILKHLRDLGVRLALDDFGTGYSSLSQLKRFPLDLIKIDKCFVDDLPGLKEDCEIASAIIAMGHALGIKVLAEGVETQAQLHFLAQQGCDFYQGYLFSQPLPAETFAERWLCKLRS